MKPNDPNQEPVQPQKQAAWVTVEPNLLRYRPSGKYYARLRVRGKLIVRSLKTNRITVARLRLVDTEKAERQRAEHLASDAAANGKLTFGDALAIYCRRLEGDLSLKVRTKVYYRERIAALKKSWPVLEKTDVAKITKAACLDWSAEFATTGAKGGRPTSPTNFNNTVMILRQVLDLAVEAGARYDNPARFIKRARTRIKAPTLPSPQQFEQLLSLVKHKGVADLIRFLAYGGFRVYSEAGKITWSDVDLEKGLIRVRGDANEGTKNWEPRPVRMTPAMRELVQGLAASNPNRNPNDLVMKAKQCQASIDSACKKLGIPRFKQHDLRHLFSTRCVESGLSLPATAKLLGHKDGGTLLAKRYNHVSDDHLAAKIQQVTFGNEPPVAPQSNGSVTISAAEHAKLLAEVQALRSQIAATTTPPAPVPNKAASAEGDFRGSHAE
jgi:integrase